MAGELSQSIPGLCGEALGLAVGECDTRLEGPEHRWWRGKEWEFGGHVESLKSWTMEQHVPLGES